jgi:YaiO family outer membrane protein
MRILTILTLSVLLATVATAQTIEQERHMQAQRDTAIFGPPVPLLLPQGDTLALTGAEPWQFELGGEYYALSGGKRVHDSVTFDPWTALYLDFNKKISTGQTLYGGVRMQERFTLQDFDLYAGYYFPIKRPLTASVEAHFSPTHEIMAKWSAAAQLYYSFPIGLTIFAGANHREYNTLKSNGFNVGGEYYFSDYRLAYTLFGRLLSGSRDDEGINPAHLFMLNRYYGEANTIGLGVAFGRDIVELGRLGDEQLLRFYNTRSIFVLGRHWLNVSWAVSYEAGYHMQGDLYNRVGGRLGIRYRLNN